MSDPVIRQQIRQQLYERGLYDRLLTTEEAAAATGLSQYELRMGAKAGRYPVLLGGSADKRFRKMKWNLEALEDAIRQQMDRNCGRDDC